MRTTLQKRIELCYREQKQINQLKDTQEQIEKNWILWKHLFV